MPEANFDGSPPVGSHDVILSHNLLRHITAGVTIFTECILVFTNMLPVLSIIWIKCRLERTNMDLAVLALSLCDILSVVIPAPVWMMHYITGVWIGGKPVCLFYQAVCTTLQLSSLLLAAHLCIERANVGSQLHCKLKLDTQSGSSNAGHGRFLERLHSTKTLFITLIIFVVSAAVALLPTVFHLAPRDQHDNNGISSQKICLNWLLRIPKSWHESTFFFTFASIVALGLFVIVVCNIIISIQWVLIRQCKSPTNSAELDGVSIEVVATGFRPASVEDERICEFNQSRHIVALITICVLITWTPTLVCSVLIFLGFNVPGSFLVFSLLSTTLSGIFYPFIYLAFSPSFRNGYRQVIYQISKKFFCHCCKNEQSIELSRDQESSSQNFNPPIKREETTQFMLSMTTTSLQAISDTTNEDGTMSSQKFTLHNPSFDVSEEAEELLLDNFVA